MKLAGHIERMRCFRKSVYVAEPPKARVKELEDFDAELFGVPGGC